MSEKQIEQIGAQIQSADRFLITTHIRPDGDAIGSLLGLGLALLQTGKPVQMISEDGLPSAYKHLKGSDLIKSKIKHEPGLVIVLDCSDLERTGSLLKHLGPPDINIDHHITNLNFAKLNFVDIQAVATAEIIAYCLESWGLEMSQDVASALLTGLITDTLGFRTSNMSPQALHLAAKLMETGADLPALYMRSLVEHSYEAVRLWGNGLSNLERDGKLIWTSLTRADRIASGYSGEDDADLINILSAVQDAAVSIIFVEQGNGKVKVSWRALIGYDVSKIALDFGGGGHPAAAGAEIRGSLVKVRQQVLDATRQILVN